MSENEEVEFKREIASIVRASLDDVVAMGGDATTGAGTLFSKNYLPEDEVVAWSRYELELIARAVENGGEPETDPTMCSGIDLFYAKEGHDILAPAIAAEAQIYMVGLIMDYICERYKEDPERLDAARQLFVQSVRPYIMVNARSFLLRIEEGIALLGSKRQMRPPAMADAKTRNTGSEAPFAAEGLTQREELVVHLVAQGMSNGEIAAQLRITQNTVKNHIRHILEKTGLENRVQLAVRATQREP